MYAFVPEGFPRVETRLKTSSSFVGSMSSRITMRSGLPRSLSKLIVQSDAANPLARTLMTWTAGLLRNRRRPVHRESKVGSRLKVTSKARPCRRRFPVAGRAFGPR